MRYFLLVVFALFSLSALAQHTITIDGNFDDWSDLPVLVTDPPHDEHDTDWFGDGLTQPRPRKYADVDILEVKFTNDAENLYGYVKARGVIGRTSRSADGQKAGRYYFIITIDVDNNDTTGYALQEGNYWPNSRGYDMNMEVEFYNGAFNTGHYINHEFLSEAALAQGRIDLANHIIRLRPGTYDYYLQWVTFPDTSFVYVEDKGPVVNGGIIEVAVSPDGHEAEMKAPMWGFFWDEHGVPIVQVGNTIDVSFSLEASGELSESAQELGYHGNHSVWGSDTAEPIVGYKITAPTAVTAQKTVPPGKFMLHQNYPNPFNSSTSIGYTLQNSGWTSLVVYNALGQPMAHLVEGPQSAGFHRANWNGQTENGKQAPSGLYFWVLRQGNQKQMKRGLLLK